MNARVSRWLKWVALPISWALVFGVGLAQQQNRPDIQVTTPITLESPKERGALVTIEQGDLVTIVATISNTETVPVTATFDILFQLQANGEGEPRSLGSNEVTCVTSPNSEDTSRCTLFGLSARGDPGDQSDIRAQLNTSQLTPGQYTLIVVADSENKVAETDENNNFGQGLLTVTPRLPNLTILSKTALLPSQPKQGDLSTFEFTIENDRPMAVITSFRVSLALRKHGEIPFNLLVSPALSCPDCTISALGANSRKTIRAQLVTILLDPGEYQLRVTVDSDGAITEADETDNVLTVDFILGDPLRNLTISQGRLTPSTPAQDSLISLGFTVRNESIAAVTGVQLQFSLSQSETGTVFDLRDLPAFACGPVGSFESGKDTCTALTVSPNGAVEVLVQFAATDLALGSYELRVIVDPATAEEPEGAIVETDERDNTLVIPFVLVEPGKETPQVGPELHPIGLALVPASPVVQGQKVLISATIANTGNQDAGAFRVEFSFRREDVSQPQGFAAFATQTVSSLRLGKTIEARSILDTTGLEPGLYAIKVVVNALGQAELDDNNNALIAFVTVSPKP